MNTSTGEGVTSGWNNQLQSIPSREAQLAIERAYRTMGRPFSRPRFWDDAVAVPWQSGATTVVRDVRVTDAAPRKHNTCRVTDVLDRSGKRIPPRRTRAGDGLLPPPSGRRIPPRRRTRDADVEELMNLVARYFMRENSSSTIDHETDLRQEDSIQSRAYRDTWGRPENQSARSLASSSDPLREAERRARAMDSLGLDFHERLQAQCLETGMTVYFPEWSK